MSLYILYKYYREIYYFLAKLALMKVVVHEIMKPINIKQRCKLSLYEEVIYMYCNFF